MTGRPHVCFLAPHTYPLLSGNEDVQIIGGAQLQQVIIARCLASRGFQVSMICLDFGQEDQIVIDGIRVFRAFRPDAGVPILRFLSPRLSSIWKCMKAVDADIYYQRSAAVWTGVMAGFCRRHGKKSIFAAAGNPDLESRTSRIRYTRDRWIFEYGLRNVDRIFVQNDEQARLCEANFGRQAIQIPNCYPEPARRSGSAEGHILWVSTIRQLKRPELFLDLALALPDYRFRMIGGQTVHEPHLYDAIKTRATGIPNVEFLGFVPYSRIDEHFDGAAALVNTSTSEGFPNTFLQAWARGIPTVSFVDCGAHLAGKPVGLTIDCLSAMAAAVTRVKTDKDFRAAEASRCVEYFRRFHLPDRVVDLYVQTFNELLSRPAGPIRPASLRAGSKDPGGQAT